MRIYKMRIYKSYRDPVTWSLFVTIEALLRYCMQ